MEILVLTTFFSVLVAALFLILFLRTRQSNAGSSIEQDSLIPLWDGDLSNRPTVSAKVEAVPAKVEEEHGQSGVSEGDASVVSKKNEYHNCLKQCWGCRAGKSCHDNH